MLLIRTMTSHIDKLPLQAHNDMTSPLEASPVEEERLHRLETLPPNFDYEGLLKHTIRPLLESLRDRCILNQASQLGNLHDTPSPPRHSLESLVRALVETDVGFTGPVAYRSYDRPTPMQSASVPLTNPVLSGYRQQNMFVSLESLPEAIHYIDLGHAGQEVEVLGICSVGKDHIGFAVGRTPVTPPGLTIEMVITPIPPSPYQLPFRFACMHLLKCLSCTSDQFAGS